MILNESILLLWDIWWYYIEYLDVSWCKIIVLKKKDLIKWVIC